VDYLKPSGAIGFYYPDWVLVQKAMEGEVTWIVETKGREWEGTKAKDAAIEDWCARVTAATGQTWMFIRVNQREFEMRSGRTTFAGLLGEIEQMRKQLLEG
jgi:type III restriction enzyme